MSEYRFHLFAYTFFVGLLYTKPAYFVFLFMMDILSFLHLCFFPSAPSLCLVPRVSNFSLVWLQAVPAAALIDTILHFLIASSFSLSFVLPSHCFLQCKMYHTQWCHSAAFEKFVRPWSVVYATTMFMLVQNYRCTQKPQFADQNNMTYYSDQIS